MEYTATVGGLADFLNDWAPVGLAESYDNVGLLVGRREWHVERVLVALDITEAIVEEAVQRGAQAIVAHHPVVFQGLKKLVGQSDAVRAVECAIQSRIALLAAHTNLDAVADGVSVHLAQKLGLETVRILEPRAQQLLNLTVFVPTESVSAVREAVFAAGAGKVGNYDRCGFSTPGVGTFRPLERANPAAGTVGKEEEVNEVRIEFLVPKTRRLAVERALFAAHPYEVVAHFWHEHQGLWEDVGFGAVGNWSEGKTWEEAVQTVKSSLGLSSMRHSSPPKGLITCVAVCGGSGSDLLENAQRSGAQLFITSDVKYHRYFDADSQCALVDIGHAESEQHTVELMIARISEKFRNFAVLGAETRTNPVTTS
jgi:dinuclear metal center YbgI/SA1388 family protein